MKTPIRIGLALAIVAFGVWFYFTPHLAFQNMRAAADAKDSAKLARYIDFHAVRESLKATFNAKMMGEMTKLKESANPFAGLGAAFAMALVGPMVDAMVTPEAMAMMMKGEKPNPDSRGQPGPIVRPVASKSPEEPESDMFYESFDQFVVMAKKRGATDEPVGMVLQRQGLFSWKVVSIRLPI